MLLYVVLPHLRQLVPAAGLDWSQLGPLGVLVAALFGTLSWAWRRDVARADRMEAEVRDLNAEIRDLLRANARLETATAASTAVRRRSER